MASEARGSQFESNCFQPVVSAPASADGVKSGMFVPITPVLLSAACTHAWVRRLKDVTPVPTAVTLIAATIRIWTWPFPPASTVEKQTGHKRSEERQADLLPPRMPKLKEELRAKGLLDTDEMAVLHAMFPHELEKLLKPAPVAPAAPVSAPAIPVAPVSAAVSAPTGAGTRYSITLEGRAYGVAVEEVGNG